MIYKNSNIFLYLIILGIAILLTTIYLKYNENNKSRFNKKFLSIRSENPDSIEFKIRNVVIWGHKLHSHTHSYIHNAFKIAFKHLGYQVFWFDDEDDVSGLEFSKDLFITEGQVDKNIPLIKNCFYILHNCDHQNYHQIPIKNKITLQVYTKNADNETPLVDHRGKQYPFHFYNNNGRVIFQPWATDRLPNEIDKNIECLRNIATNKKHKNFYFVGYSNDVWHKWKTICEKKGYPFKSIGGFSGKNITKKENEHRIQNSIFNVAIQSEWQVNKGYIPCRVFKILSSGRMSGTNNYQVYKLFHNKIIYDEDFDALFDKCLHEESKLKNDTSHLKYLMIDIRDNHTYINRIQTIFLAWDLINSTTK